VHYVYVSDKKKDEFIDRFIATEFGRTIREPFSKDEVYIWKIPVRLSGLLWDMGNMPVIIYK